jgi:hypothetical protein
MILTGRDIIAITNVVPDSDDPPEQFATNHEANNATIDCQMNMDLVADKTVKSLMNYTASLGMTALNSNSKEEDAVDDAEPIIGSFRVPLLDDGNLSWAINKIIWKNCDDYSNKVKGFFGGLHLVLETHKKRGDMFGPTHL